VTVQRRRGTRLLAPAPVNSTRPSSSRLPPPYGRRTGGVRALWVVDSSSALHTDHMAVTTVTTCVAGAAEFIGRAFAVFHRAGACRRSTAWNDGKMQRFGPTLLLALPLLVALIPEAVDSTRTIEVTVSRYALSPERIEVRVGERVRLQVVSVDGTDGFQVKALGLYAAIPADGRTVTVELAPTEVGTFEIDCSYCGPDHGQASLIVTPADINAD
jgi:heme/copper-type cytochrome/quinol oxidase subunit 2